MEDPNISYSLLQYNVTILPNYTFNVFLTANVCLFVDHINLEVMFANPYLNFGPQMIKNGFVSSLQSKAFGIEFTDDTMNSYILLDETIQDEEFYW